MVSRASLPVLRHMARDLKAPLTELARAELWALHLLSCRRHGKSCNLVEAIAGVRALHPSEGAVPFETTRKRVQYNLKSISVHSARKNFQRDGESQDAVDLAELPFRLRPATPPPPSSRAAAAPHAEASEPGASGAAMEVVPGAAERGAAATNPGAAESGAAAADPGSAESSAAAADPGVVGSCAAAADPGSAESGAAAADPGVAGSGAAAAEPGAAGSGSSMEV